MKCWEVKALDLKPISKKIVDFPEDFLEKVKKAYPDDRTMAYLVYQGHGHMGSRLHNDARMTLSASDILNHINRGASGIKELRKHLKEIQVAQELYDEFRVYHMKHLEEITRRKNEKI